MSIRSSHATRTCGGKGRSLRSLLFASTALSANLSGAQAQPVFDGTTGNQVPGTVVTDTIDVSQGTRAGSNVFHSFSSFSIGAGQIVTYTDSTPTTPVERIINRVTGTSISEINGTLRSAVPGADLYLINPNGVVMGPGSIVDVPAGFHMSTADELRFSDGSALQASIGDSTFTSAAPQAFGFTDSIVGDISITEGRVNARSVGLVGGHISLLDGTIPDLGTSISAPSINIVAVKGIGNVPIDPASAGLVVAEYGNVYLVGGNTDLVNNAELDATSLLSFALAPALISVRGRAVQTAGATIISVDSTDRDGGDIQIFASESVLVDSGTQIRSIANSNKGGAIRIEAPNIRIHEANRIRDNRPTIDSLSFGATGGQILLTALGTLRIEEYASIKSTAFSSAGDVAIAGDVRLAARNVVISRTTPPASEQDLNVASQFFYSGDGSGERGEAGDVAILADNLFELSNGRVGTLSFVTCTDQACATGPNVAGMLTISGAAGSRLTVRGGRIDTQLFGSGPAQSLLEVEEGAGGDMSITGFSDIQLLGGSSVASSLACGGCLATGSQRFGGINLMTPGKLTSDGGTIQSNGGAPVSVDADEIELASGILGSAAGQEAASPVDLRVRAKRISLTGGQIAASSASLGSLGTVTITADVLTLTGSSSKISADSGGEGSGANGGLININARTIEVTDGARLSAVAGPSGDAGTITICCSASLTVTGNGSLIIAGTSRESTGNAGRILVSGKEVTLANGGRMTVASEGAGRGGEILVRTQRFTASDPLRQSEGRDDRLASGIATLSGTASPTSAAAGRIMIEAGVFNLFDGAVITTDTFGSVPAGSISLRASELNIKGEQALVSSRAAGLSGADAGDIDIGTVNFTLSDGASFSTLARSGGGGNIKFAWNGIGRINNATVKTDVLGGAGGGGTITFGGTVELLDFDTLFQRLCGDLATSFATYEGLKAYDPKSTATPVLQLNNATLSASAQQGSGGTVVISPRVVVISNVDLPSDFNVASLTGPDGSVIAPAPFAPPPVVIMPERNITSRCDAARRRNALTDGLSGRMDVGDDLSALLPAGLPGSADRVLAETVERLCAA